MRLLDVDAARYLFPVHKLRARKTENVKVVLPGVGRPALAPERSQAGFGRARLGHKPS